MRSRQVPEFRSRTLTISCKTLFRSLDQLRISEQKSALINLELRDSFNKGPRVEIGCFSTFLRESPASSRSAISDSSKVIASRWCPVLMQDLTLLLAALINSDFSAPTSLDQSARLTRKFNS